MRGRIFILIGAVVLLGVLAAVLFLFRGGDDDTGDENTGVNVEESGDETDGGPDAQGDDDDDDGGGEPVVDDALFKNIVVAVQDLPRGSYLADPNNPDGRLERGEELNMIYGLRVQPWPVQALPADGEYIEDVNFDDVYDKVLRTDVFRGQPILRQYLADDLGDLAERGSDAAAILANIEANESVSADELGQYVAISIPLDPSGIGQVAYAVQDGDYVDVILSFLFVDVDPNFQTRLPNTFSLITTLETGELSIGAPRQGRLTTETEVSVDGVLLGPSENSQRPRLVTQRVVTDAFVVHIGYFPEGGRFIGPTPTPLEIEAPPPPPEENEDATPIPTDTPYAPLIITLGVSPQDALILTWAVDAQIPITLALRQVGDHSSPETGNVVNPVTLEYMMNFFEEGQPPEKQGYALEPPITSIRRFDVGTLYTFLGAILSEETE
ncbi:MAG: hypothetical protein GYB65_13115 [Chloroflexi bacterium]|nr:hypothetical protein [Chloroflexota bacterium]